MKAPPNMMILASAGSGKTYTLTNRYIRLLAAGAEPAGIVALTFTRKAAGEFFDEILNKLSQAADDAKAARKLSRELNAATLKHHDFSRLLRQLIDTMPRLTLSTFDAFFARIVKAFPFELGLDGDFQILEEHAARIERRRVLQHMFARTGRRPNDSQREFADAFKRATFGVEEKRLSAQLDTFLDNHQELYLTAPTAAVWGAPERIWPGGSDWDPPNDALSHALAQLDQLLAARTDLTDKQRARWQAFLETAAEWTPGAPLSKPAEYVLKNTLNAWPDVLRGTAEITIERKKVALSEPECAALARCVRGIIGGELARRLEITAGIFEVLDGYDTFYRATVRRAGKMTFADVQRVLAPDGGAPQLSLSRTEDFTGRRLLIDWRLDGRYDHWLLDEFQDTSHGQWSVIRNLIDEVMQDTSGTRSFFYVGDVKQAIYAWREGDSRLFREIFDRYRGGGEHAIQKDRLDKSWRSGPAILDMVNRVFGQPAVLRALFPAEAANRWNRDWADHESAHARLTGQAAWLHAANEEERFARTHELLQIIQPLQRGLTAAVLVQKNDTANRLADYLRRVGAVPAVAESDLHVATDNPLTSSLLALLQAAAHPHDTLAWEHTRMSPWWTVMQNHGTDSTEALTTHTLELIHHRGFEDAADWWLTRAEPTLDSDDAFSRERARQFVAAARIYDQTTADRDVADFIDFMHRHTVRDAEADAVVRVMTIHKAKGLGFDVVLLPDLEGQKLASRREGLAVRKDANRAVQWILDLPPRIFCEPDPVLKAYIEDAEADACFDKLALLYVAMTRAKRAMYVITERKSRSTSHNFAKLLASTLGDASDTVAVGDQHLAGGTAFGEPKWFTSIDAKPDEPAAPRLPRIDADALARLQIVQRRSALTPSQAATGPVAGASLFAPAPNAARRFGEEVHRLLGSVRWWTPADGDDWVATRTAAGFSSDAITTARACLDAPELAEVFIARAGRRTHVWTERSFEAVVNDRWITGRFDRVVIERDSAGVAVNVSVFDFKTDQLPRDECPDWSQLAARHRAQMELYRRATSLLTAVPTERVTCALVFTAALDDRGTRAAPVVLPYAAEP